MRSDPAGPAAASLTDDAEPIVSKASFTGRIVAAVVSVVTAGAAMVAGLRGALDPLAQAVVVIVLAGLVVYLTFPWWLRRMGKEIRDFPDESWRRVKTLREGPPNDGPAVLPRRRRFARRR
jgi:uncharacterized protein YjeT (DUF2065 family)